MKEGCGTYLRELDACVEAFLLPGADCDGNGFESRISFLEAEVA